MIKSFNLNNNISLDNFINKNNESNIFNGSENLNELKTIINYNYYNIQYKITSNNIQSPKFNRSIN